MNRHRSLVRTVHISVLILCTAAVHSKAQNSFDNLHSFHQTINTAQMMSVGSQGGGEITR